MLIPNIDAKAPDYYLPLVYFTDGIEPPQWGAICLDLVNSPEATVVCNQIGYEFDDFKGSK